MYIIYAKVVKIVLLWICLCGLFQKTWHSLPSNFLDSLIMIKNALFTGVCKNIHSVGVNVFVYVQKIYIHTYVCKYHKYCEFPRIAEVALSVGIVSYDQRSHTRVQQLNTNNSDYPLKSEVKLKLLLLLLLTIMVTMKIMSSMCMIMMGYDQTLRSLLLSTSLS